MSRTESGLPRKPDIWPLPYASRMGSAILRTPQGEQGHAQVAIAAQRGGCLTPQERMGEVGPSGHENGKYKAMGSEGSLEQ